MPLRVGGKALGPPPEKLLDWLASVWVEATEAGNEVRWLEAKMAKQERWLDANRGHALYAERCHQAAATRKRHEQAVYRIRGLARNANEIADLMDGETKRKAKECVHAWSTIGAPGVEAVAWNLVPDPAWLEEE